MDAIHVLNLDKYNTGYKDRPMRWCKLYFATLATDYNFATLLECDKWRYFAFIMLELQAKKPVPADERYLSMHGFDFKHRALKHTFNALVGRRLIELSTACSLSTQDKKGLKTPISSQNAEGVDNTPVTQDENERTPKTSVACSRIDKNRIDKIGGERNVPLRPPKEMLVQFFKDNGSTETQAMTFFDHFESNGWKVGGKTKMVDWQASARNWIRRNGGLAKAMEASASCDVHDEKGMITDGQGRKIRCWCWK